MQSNDYHQSEDDDYETKLGRLRKDPNVSDQYIHNFMKAEILRQAYADVQKRANDLYNNLPIKKSAIKVTRSLSAQKQQKNPDPNTEKIKKYDLFGTALSTFDSQNLVGTPLVNSKIQSKIQKRIQEIKQKQKEVEQLQLLLSQSQTTAHQNPQISEQVVLNQILDSKLAENLKGEFSEEFGPSSLVSTENCKQYASKGSEEEISNPYVSSSLNRGQSGFIKKFSSQIQGPFYIGPALKDAVEVKNTKQIQTKSKSPIKRCSVRKSSIKNTSKKSLTEKQQIIQLQSFNRAYTTETANSKFRNPELEAATAEIQEEFDRVLRSNIPTSSHRTTQADLENEFKMEEFYKVMGEFYSNDYKPHSSPTKRLIQQKNSTVEHKNQLKNCHTQSYSLHYTSAPGKSYVIEPEGGELDYDLARLNPLKFYQQVLSQNVIQHKASDLGHHKVHVTHKVTHRKIGRILLLVQNKLVEFLKNRWSPEELTAAFTDQKVQNTMQKLIKDGALQLRHKDSLEPIFRSELQIIAKLGDRAVNSSSPDDGGKSAFVEEANLVSKNLKLIFQHVNEDGLQQVHKEVAQFIKRQQKL